MVYTVISGVDIAAPSAPTLAISSTAGSLSSGTYQYEVTIVTDGGESLPSSSASIAASASQSITVTLPAYGNYTSSYNIYRTAANGATYTLVTTVDSPTLTYTDGNSDASISANASPPVFNTSDSRWQINGFVRFGEFYGTSIDSGLTAHAGGGQSSATQLVKQVNVVATVATAADSVRLMPLDSDMVGVPVSVLNTSANSLNVFPYTGQSINGTTNASAAVAAGALRTFIGRTSTDWST